jgi:subtilisin family serine protease
MKKILQYFFSLSIFLILSQSCNEAFEPDINIDDYELKSATSVKKSYIVVLNDSELNSELEKLKGYEKKQNAVKTKSAKILQRVGIIDGEVEHVYGTALKGFSVKIPPGQLKRLQDDPSIEYIEEDKIVSLIQPYRGKPDKGDGGGGDTSAPPQETPWGITRVNGGIHSSDTAWVIDSGIDQDHPDLNVNTALSKSFLGGKDSNNPDDQHGHGTHVAGTIGAIDNNIGVIGVAAGATVVSVRVLDRRGSGTTSGVIAGVDYVAANASSNHVANMSLGGGISTTLDNAVIIASASCKFVLAAGNESDDATNHSPARAEGANIYTISAMDSNDDWAYFSNYGSPVDYCAPGYSIYSCYKGGGYTTMSGTSMAAPHVAGLILLGTNLNGSLNTQGTVNGDPSSPADPIAVH